MTRCGASGGHSAAVARVRNEALGAALFALVAAVHFGYEPLSAGYPDPASAGRAIFYVARGVEGTALYALVWALAWRRLPKSRLGISIACSWGCFESAQTAVCRLAVGIGNRTVPGPYRGMCDLAADFPVYGMTAVLVLVAAAVMQEVGRDSPTQR